ncbi:MAG TPA: fatty acid desaturase [Caulobacteraceae bacterium]|nr:fatty acid desaturase [Caulobacteraceae bacterium]
MTVESAAPSWRKIFDAYRNPSHLRSSIELAITAGPLLALWGFAIWACAHGWWWAAALSLPAAAFLVRLFMIQHDCGHSAFFRWKPLNDWTGRIIGVLTLTPYDYWRRTHAIHHGTSGNLDRRGLGSVEMLTVDEYRAKGWLGRTAYRLYRNPAVLFVIGPAYMFILQHRLPIGLMRDAKSWFSVMATNAGVAAIVVALILLPGPGPFFAVVIPSLAIAASVGVWLFYVQHQYEGVAWARDGDWHAQDAALEGSSHYDLPPVLRWLTANVGVHHVHHVSSRVPFYRLSQVLRDHPELKAVGRVTLWQSIKGVRLALWDEASRRLVSFAEAKRLRDRSI